MVLSGLMMRHTHGDDGALRWCALTLLFTPASQTYSLARIRFQAPASDSPDHSSLQLACHTMRPGNIPSPDRGAEPECAVVRQLNRVCLIAELAHRHDRSYLNSIILSDRFEQRQKK